MEISSELIAALELAKWPILALPGVVGIGIGLREENGVLLDELAIRVHVSDRSNVPFGIPELVGGVGVCIIETHIEPCFDDCLLSVPQDNIRYNPIIGGSRIINPSIAAGTLGAVVQDRETGELFGLSCHHVVGQVNDTIWQPNTPPLVNPIPQDDILGHVKRVEYPKTSPLPFSPFLAGLVDAAIVKLVPALEQGRSLSSAFAGQNQPDLLIDRITATAVPVTVKQDPVRAQVQKRGFRTRVTEGEIIETYATYQWTAGPSNTYLVEQSCIKGISNSSNPHGVFACKGDSGSVILEKNTATAVGLLWGNSNGGTKGYMSHIHNVESQLKINMVWL